MVMMWVFVGIEKAQVFLANRAKKRSEAQQASIVGLLCLLFIYIPCFDLAIRRLISRRVSNYFTTCYGKYFKRNRGKLGSSADQYRLDYFDRWFLVVLDDAPSRNNDVDGSRRSVAERLGEKRIKNAPTYSLVVTAILTNLFLLTFLVTDYAYQFAYSLCTAAILICYLLVGIYQVQFSLKKESKTSSDSVGLL